MAIQTIGEIYWPNPAPFPPLTSFGAANNALNATTTSQAHVFQVTRSGSITGVGVATATVTTAQQCRVGLVTVDSSGNPTSTLYGGSGYATFTPAANTYYSLTLPTAATATVGDIVARVVEWTGTTGDLVIGGPQSNGAGNLLNAPYLNRFTSGAWAKFAGTYMGVSGHLLYSDGVYAGSGMYPATGAFATAAFAINSAGIDEYALAMTPASRLQVAGIWSFSSAGGGFDAVLYDGSSNTLASVAVPSGYFGNSSATSIRTSYFAAPVTVAAGALIRAAIRPSTTTAVTLRRQPVIAGANALWGLPADACESTRVDLGTWSNNQTSLPGIGLIITGLDDGVGGLILPRSMHGGYSA